MDTLAKKRSFNYNDCGDNMLKRKINQDLALWRENPSRPALLVKGPRGVGKSTSIERFAKENYKYVVKVDFEKNPELIPVFNENLDVTTLIKKVSLFLQVERIVSGQTLFFFDEIHLCPNVRVAVKNFVNNQKFDVIMATSYFGINPDIFPTNPYSYEQILDMNALGFEEYLWASGVSSNIMNDLRHYFTNKIPVPDALHELMLNVFYEYMTVGGMPEVVNSFLNTHNFSLVTKKHAKIIQTYTKDMKQYLSKPDFTKSVKCFLSVPFQLDKENKKFQYGFVEAKTAARKYEKNLLWLYYADMVDICFNLNLPKMPYAQQAKYDVFKVYYKDIGLLTSSYGGDAQIAIHTGKLKAYHGALLEAVVADILMKNGKKLYYFDRNTTLEADFLIKFNDKNTVLEVKEADNPKTKMIESMFENFGLTQAIKLSLNNVSYTKNVITYPIYMAMFL